jgi:hypothetical protein
MPAPVPSSRQYSFTGGQVGNPAAPPPGDRLDAEFDRLRAAISAVIDWVEASLAQPVLRDSGDDNAVSDAEGAAALAYRYAILAQAWAEYMPGTIPPNILAVMDITGDHWSSRWWANQAVMKFGTGTGTAASNIGRNLLHNAQFAVHQRGTGPFTASGYTADRWGMQLSFDTVNFAVQPISDAGRAQIGDEAVTVFMAATVAGSTNPGASTILYQHIEDVRRLAGKTVTVSFWAVGTAGMKLGVSLNQNLGTTGGTSEVTIYGAGQSVTLATSYQWYSLTFTLQSTSGETLGTDGNSHTTLTFWYSSGTNDAVYAGNIGVQSGTINIWGVQLEIGSAATPLEKPDPRYDLANCQRFFRSGVVSTRGYTLAGGTVQSMYALAPTMFRVPLVTLTAQTNAGNLASADVQTFQRDMFAFEIVAAAPGDVYGTYSFTASADL